MVLWNTWDILYVTVLVSWSIPSPCSCYIPRGGTPFSHEVTSKFPRSRVQNISKNHPRFFSHWIAGAAPAGIKISASSLPRLEKNRQTKEERSVAGTSSQEIANSALVAQWHRTRGNVVLQNGDKTFPTTATSSQWLKPSRVEKKNYVPHVRLSGHVSAWVDEWSPRDVGTSTATKPQRDELVEIVDDSRSSRVISAPIPSTSSSVILHQRGCVL